MHTWADLSIGENGEERPSRGRDGRFQRGGGGGPGRPAGRPNRGGLDARIIKTHLLDSWREHGPNAIRRVAEQDPATYLRLIVALLPRDDPDAGRTLLGDLDDAPAIEVYAVIREAQRLIRARDGGRHGDSTGASGDGKADG